MTLSFGFRLRPRVLFVALALAAAMSFGASGAHASREWTCMPSMEIVRHGRIVEIRLPQNGDRVVWRGVVDDDEWREIHRVIRDVRRDVQREVIRQRVRVIVNREEIRDVVRRALERIREIRFGLENEDWI